MSTDKLLVFRTVYLRAITEAWVDGKFREELTSPEPGAAIRALKARFDYDWPWPLVCDLEIASAPDQYEWISDEWVWSRGMHETLQMPLPLDPEELKIPTEYHAMALADYYRQRSSLFSDDWNAGGTRDPKQSPRAMLGGESGLNDGAPAGGFMPSDNEFSAFKVALLAAIAKAWREPAFKRMLIIDAATALHAVREYKLPWKFTLVVVEDRTSVWHPQERPGSQSQWSFETRNTLKLKFPTRPADVKCWPVALAAYNATGSEYPFSCCT